MPGLDPGFEHRIARLRPGFSVQPQVRNPGVRSLAITAENLRPQMVAVKRDVSRGLVQLEEIAPAARLRQSLEPASLQPRGQRQIAVALEKGLHLVGFGAGEAT